MDDGTIEDVKMVDNGGGEHQSWMRQLWRMCSNYDGGVQQATVVEVAVVEQPMVASSDHCMLVATTTMDDDDH